MQQEIQIKLICTQFPGLQFGPYQSVQVGMQKGDEVVDVVPGNVSEKVFTAGLRFNQDRAGKPNFIGPFVYGATGDKFLYLVWFSRNGLHDQRFRRAKIKLNQLTWEQVQLAAESKRPILAHVQMTDGKGEPVCASLKGDVIRWE